MQRPTLFDRRSAGARTARILSIGVGMAAIMVLLTLAAVALSFTRHDVANGYSGTRSVFAADVDGDTDTDLVTTAVTLNDLSWWENDGSNQFTRRSVDSALHGARAALAIDVDGDMDMDLVAAADHAGDIVWYENNGSESFAKHVVDGSLPGAHDVFALDIDGDTDVDLLGVGATANTVAWYENNGSESFTRHIIDAALDGARAVYGADIDGDMDVDVTAVAFDVDDIVWYENDGSEGFTRHLVDGAFNGASDILAIDMDGDEDIDLLASATQADYIAWYENNGSEHFTRRYVGGYFDGATAVYAADIDADNDIDVVGAAFRADLVAWFENNGSEAFSRHLLATGYNEARSVFATDIDGDNDIDILAAAAAAGQVTWWEQVGEIINHAPTLTWTGEPNYLNDGLHPETGTPADSYVYRITYSDADGDAPGFLHVHIKQDGVDIAGSPFAMSCAPGDVTSGVVCSYTKIGLDKGSDYSYVFAAEDDRGLAAAVPPAQMAPLVQMPVNHAPTLTWAGETHYEEDGLHPETGTTADTYTFCIRYADPDGDAPGTVQLHLQRDGVDVAGSPFMMGCPSGGYTAGVVCVYALGQLAAGNDYAYWFTAVDDQGHAARPTASLSAPNVLDLESSLIPVIFGNGAIAP